MDARICDAIRRRRLLRLAYAGGIRVVEPFVHGAQANGEEVLLAFQRTGASQSGETAGWKTFKVVRIAALQVLDQDAARSRPGYTGAARHVAHVCCRA